MMTRDYAAPDWRGLCVELVLSWDADGCDWKPQHQARWNATVDRARAALAQPEPEVVGPTDGEPPPGPFSEHDLRQQWNQQADEFNQWDSLDSSEQLAWAQVRAIAADRARWGRPAPAPVGDCPACEGTPKPGNQPCAVCGRPASVVDGEEVAGLAWWLRSLEGASVWFETGSPEAQRLARAADLLERQAAPVPVAVSERLPEAGDCLGRPTEDSDAGWCWTYSGALEVWRFQSVVFPRPYPEPPRVTLSPSVTHWLPAHALPLPSGEVEA